VVQKKKSGEGGARKKIENAALPAGNRGHVQIATEMRKKWAKRCNVTKANRKTGEKSHKTRRNCRENFASEKNPRCASKGLENGGQQKTIPWGGSSSLSRITERNGKRGANLNSGAKKRPALAQYFRTWGRGPMEKEESQRVWAL